jgi:hypothetical protein
MQFTSKFFLIAVLAALACGGTAVSAAPVWESSVAARSADSDMPVELFVREPKISRGKKEQRLDKNAVSPFAALK